MRERMLRDLLPGIPVQEEHGSRERRVTGLAYDSREVEPGFLFVAMDGQHTDGHRFIPQAVSRGAAAVVHASPLAEYAPTATYVRVASPRRVLSPIAAAFYGNPSLELGVIGVTGTDGKSSTVWFIAQILARLGYRAGFLSTVSFQVADRMVKNPFRQSTPEASEIHGMLREMVETGRQYAVVEATSHGLSERMNRLADVAFDAAVFTNVTHEHLEFHGTFEQYRSDKANLFRALDRTPSKTGRGGGAPLLRAAVVNADDPSAEYFRASTTVHCSSYGLRARADLSAREIRADITGSRFLMRWEGKEAAARVAIPGPFWVENSLAACLTVSRALGLDPLSLAPEIQGLRSVQGRMDYVDQGQPFALIVDYAHTPGAFEKLFPWIREHTPGRITVVFGSAGERDREKRRMQGRVASRHCDTLVLTDEDPRGEDRMAILEQIAEGCESKTRGKDLFLVPDRPEAIRFAVSRAGSGDTILLLGKGHEGSIIGPTGPAPWDERAEAEGALRELGYGGAGR
ncbi:MAG TPA: UDP-N-acetylmuramoyl-L-alanyl-D-glutamate--2,6-diaminopimelate ligase [Spirochaetia bacterium]|nr:UDP-N-acetylmuramoyl-L-alanyl-D-glutamate--2,6-diaminopimelate ligase [Spirochaetia bacterium]